MAKLNFGILEILQKQLNIIQIINIGIYYYKYDFWFNINIYLKGLFCKI